MQFSDTTNNQGIIQTCESTVFGNEDYGKISDNTARLQTFTRHCNRALDNIAISIHEADSRWEWDDTNYSDYPIATADLVGGQQDYQLSTDHLRIISVEVQSDDGRWSEIEPIDQSGIPGARTEFLKEDGRPRFYDKLANSIFLYPAPAAAQVTTTAGLKIYFQRQADYFDPSDTTKVPGIPTHFHELVPMWASQKYMFDNNQHDKANILRQEIIDKQERKLKMFFDRRDGDITSKITVRDNRRGRNSAR
jgi:hypothetical protein